MPGSFGTTNNDDGAVASTGASEKSGIFGRNDATTPAPAGSVGGSGVFGLSLVPNASGVFGANNGGGTGVFGESASGDGVIGATQSSAKTGIFGKNDATTPAPAGTVGGNGVFGLSLVPNASGVFGANNGGGNGVTGISEKGIGVLAKGGRLAAQFEGNVDISGALTIQGVSIQVWFQRIIALEQRDNNLQQQIISLNQQVNNLQQQLASLQQKEIADRQDEITGIQILAARVTALGG